MSTTHSSSSTSLSTTTNSISTMAMTFASIPIHHAVTIKLTKKNYLLWHAPLLPYLRSTNLMGYLDGSTPMPAKQVASSTAAGAELVSNPAYTAWYNQDQQLLSGLLSSMVVDVLHDVSHAASSKEAWDILKRMFSTSTRARTVQICVELATSKKLDLSAANYFAKIKNLAAEMAAAEAPLSDDEVLSYFLAGLPSDYDSFVTSITTKNEALSLEEVYAHLMAYEAHQLRHQSKLHAGHGSSVNYAGRGGGSCGRGRSDHGRERSSFRGGSSPCPTDNRDCRPTTTRPPCQICGKVGHTALRCWHRMDESYQEFPLSASLAATSYQVDPNWYTDTGAMDHITSDLDRLIIRERYMGDEQVQVGNGAGLQIMHTSHSSVNTAARSLILRDILHVPQIAKDLLSVHKFSYDNDVFFHYKKTVIGCALSVAVYLEPLLDHITVAVQDFNQC
jgi:hypothetical protein